MGKTLAVCAWALYLGVSMQAGRGWSQATGQSGGIHGAVTDANGASRDGARVELTPNGAAARVLTTDSDGRFTFESVPAGAFKLTVTLTGFAPRNVTGVLRAGESLEMPSVVLVVAGGASEVEVRASAQEIEQEQVKEEEKQRVFGVVPNYYVTYVAHPQPLSGKQKFYMALKSEADPFTFVATGVFAGVQQANNSLKGYGQGMEGYGKRYGAGYLTGFDNVMIGSGLLPVVLKQDPRYFYKGTGTVSSRVWYALANSVVCKGDNGKWQANYSGIVGELAAGGLSNLYYPAGSRDSVGVTFENAGWSVAGGMFQNLMQEFVIRKLTPKLPNYGGH